MDELDSSKLRPADDGREIESEKEQRGEEIEVGEDRLSSRATTIHEHIRREGEKEMERDALALLRLAIAADLSMGASLLAKGIFHVKLERIPDGFLLENLGYTFGFIIAIMARQQLFTENTVTAALPAIHNPTLGNIGLLMRLWSVVLAGNPIGTAVAAWAFNFIPIFDESTRQAFASIAGDVMKNSLTEMPANVIIFGWLIITMAWMPPIAGAAKIVVIILMIQPTVLAGMTHIAVGSVEILYLVLSGSPPWSGSIWSLALSTPTGNICGGTFIFTLLSHAQVRNDMSSKRKARVRVRAAEKAKNTDRV